MKRLWLLVCVFFCMILWVQGELRTWKSADGQSTIEASMVRVDGNKVELARKDGRRIMVPIGKLCEADQQYIRQTAGAGNAGDSGSSMNTSNLPYEVGKVAGPIKVGGDVDYFYYVPKSLTPGRKVPLLLYTHLGGGARGRLQQLTHGAEVCRWIIAISEEPRKPTTSDTYDVDMEAYADNGENVVDHILNTLPVDEDRLYFFGNSTACSVAFYNYENLDGYGLMPSIGVIPLEFSAPSCDAFIINGSWDYCRYASAYARKAIGGSVIHRFHANGHADAPPWLIVEGMVWLEGRYLADKGKKQSEVLCLYESSVLEWIGTLSANEPHRAYYWAKFLQEELRLSDHVAAAVSGIVNTLGGDRNNQLYVEGIEAIDEFSVRKLSKFGRYPLFEHTDNDLVADWEEMLVKYRSVPVIEELLKSFCHPTDHSR